jgi:hypothetical protein
MKKTNIIRKSGFTFILVVLILTSISFTFAGVWTEPSVSSNATCAGFSHTMCAEFGPNYVPGIGNAGLIPYSNESGVNKTGTYCAITYDSGASTYGFNVINDTSIQNVSDLKASDVLGDEIHFQVIYDFVDARHYDENCNADEMFGLNGDGTLNFSKYIENGVTYDVSINELAIFENLDTFDLIATDENNSLLDLGTYVYGDVIDTQTGLPVGGANITLYFKNPLGTLVPYLSFISNEDGTYTTLTISRNITSYFGTYVNVTRIPITDYIVVTQHPGYETSTKELISVGSPAYYTIELDPFSICQPDCTYQTDSTCHATCNGINGCEFPTLPVDPPYNLVSTIDGLTKGFEYEFIYVGPDLLNNGSSYVGVACEKIPDPVDSSSFEGNSQCGPDQNTWKTERIVNLQGKLVRMFITYCE